jgi:hypothetical protein
MPIDPQNRLTGENVQPVQPERPSGLVPEDVAEPDQKLRPAETDWLSMTTADPAFFLKDSNPE